ncbi:MAG: branched-chain amino acid ABC transporter permease [Candidatus Bathyarchaeia archaeon]
MNWLVILNLSFRALLFGGFLSLAACGLSLAFQLGFINAAHGDMAVLAAYLSWTLLTIFGIDPFISLIIVAPLIVTIGFALQKFLLNRFLLRGQMDTVLIITFSIGMIIRNAIQLIFFADPRSLAQPYILQGFSIGFLNIPFAYLINFIFALMMFTILHLFFVKTFAGRAFRAVPQDCEAAMMFGVKPEVAYMYGMGIMALTQAVFGVLMGVTYVFFPTSGMTYLLLPLGAIMLAGLGSLKKTFIGGLIMGEILILSGYFFGSEYQYIICHLITLILILFRPEGLLTRRS